jgi:hypothetical protein
MKNQHYSLYSFERKNDGFSFESSFGDKNMAFSRQLPIFQYIMFKYEPIKGALYIISYIYIYIYIPFFPSPFCLI